MAAVEEDATMEAQNILKELERLMGGTDVQGKPNQAGGLSPTGQAAMGAPGAGMPAGATGMSPEALPGEASGGMPPGALNARLPGIAEGEM